MLNSAVCRLNLAAKVLTAGNDEKVVWIGQSGFARKEFLPSNDYL